MFSTEVSPLFARVRLQGVAIIRFTLVVVYSSQHNTGGEVESEQNHQILASLQLAR